VCARVQAAKKKIDKQAAKLKAQSEEELHTKVPSVVNAITLTRL
jgi:hypothetical protein